MRAGPYLTMRQVETETRPGGGFLTRRLCAVRPFSFSLTALPVLAAAAAAAPPARWRWDLLSLSVLGVLLLHSAGNLLNDYFDFRSGVDRRVAGDRGRPGRLLLRGELTPGQVLAQAVACLVLALPVIGYVTWQRGPVVLAFAAAAVFGLYAYTGPPFRLKYRALGEPLVFLIFGPALMLGAAYAQTGRFEMNVLRLSIPVGIATTAVLLGNNIRDRREDRAAGIRTIAHLAAGRSARLLYVFLLLAATVGLAGLALAGFAPKMLLASPLLLVLVARPILDVRRGRRLPDIDVQTARFVAILLVLILLSLVFQS